MGLLQLPQPRATGKVRATVVFPTLPHTCSCQLLSGSHHLIPAAMGKWGLREFLSLVGVTQQRGRAGILAGPGRLQAPLRFFPAAAGPCQEHSGCLGVALSCQSIFRVFQFLVGRSSGGFVDMSL